MKTPYGFYLYNNTQYKIREDALDAALAAKDYSPDIQFDFHDDVFTKLNWMIEPEETINQLYKMRAQQIRDKYDYIILQFSGGADSNQILQTFLDNNIFIDEVRINYALAASNSFDLRQTPNRRDPLGLLYEYKLAALPRLKDLARRSPKTKIEVVDLEPDIKRMYGGGFTIDGIIQSPVWFHRIRVLSQIESIDRTHEQTVGVIYGAEKPNMLLAEHGLLFFYFSDIGRTGAGRELPNDRQHSVLFYWDPDFPLIPIKQSHIIRRALSHIQKFYDAAAKKYWKVRETDIVKALLYPSFDKTIYQKIKEDERVDNTIIHTLFGSKAKDEIQEQSDFVINKYVRLNIPKGKMGSLIFRSRPYYIGRVSRPDINLSIMTEGR